MWSEPVATYDLVALDQLAKLLRSPALHRSSSSALESEVNVLRGAPRRRQSDAKWTLGHILQLSLTEQNGLRVDREAGTSAECGRFQAAASKRRHLERGEAEVETFVDKWVLASQQWLNKTFGSVNGWTTVTEDGVTGQGTENGLIEGLQSLLGISPVVASFGPTTWADLQAHGPVSASDSTTWVTLVQAALYCKGYDGAGLSGTWSDSEGAVQNFSADLGLSVPVSSVGLEPKTFRALLNTDPAVLISGGTDEARQAQQFLNAAYTDHDGFFYNSTGGVFDRPTQENLVKGIQYGLGQSDAEADGAFGPTTGGELKADSAAVVEVGSSGSTWVYLFKAALTFNGYIVPFDSTFTSSDSTVVKTFQQFEGFTAAEQTGIGDYTTWAELLVSTGDPTRPGTAADMASTITAARASTLVAAGYKYVGRYLTNEQVSDPLDKDIKPGELDTIFGAGLRLFPIFEEGGYDLSWFSHDQGVADATRAVNAALGYSLPTGTVIYFAVDVDVEQVDIDAQILPYFRGIQAQVAAMGGIYSVGVYGARNVCINVSEHGLALSSFVGGLSTGWSGNLGFRLPSNWSFNQIESLTVGSGGAGQIDVDKDIASGRDQGVSSTTASTPPNHAFFAWLDALQALADGWAADHSGSDSPNLLVLEYIRYPNYGSATGEYSGSQYGWDAIAGTVDPNWRTYPDSQGLTRIETFTDPNQPQIPIKSGHLCATMNGIIHQGGTLTAAGVNLADAGGWGGDFMTLFVDFVKNNPTNLDAYNFGLEYIANRNEQHTFPYDNYLEDADGLLIGLQALASPNTPINVLIRSYYGAGGGWATRFSDYRTRRFEGSDEGVIPTTVALLSQTEPADPGWALFRGMVLATNGVNLDQISTADNNALASAHATVLDSLIANQ